MSCATKPSLSPYLDGELLEKELSAVQTHLDACGQCRADLEGLRAVGSLLKSLPEKALPQGFARRLQERKLSPLKTPAPPRRNRAVLAFACAAAAFALYRAAPPPVPPAPTPASIPAPAPGGPIAERMAEGAGAAAKAPEKSSGEELTNETLHARLQEEAKTMGIKALEAPGETDIAEQALRSRMEGPTTRAQTQLYMQRLAALRRAMGVSEPISVPIAGKTTILLANDEAVSGGPLKAAAKRQNPSEPVAGAIEHGWVGQYGGGNDAGTQTVSDADSWKKLWKSLSTAQLPPVDFTRFEVVAVFLGPRPSGGFRVDIKEVKATESFVLVRYQETAPPPGRTPPEGLTSPYVLRVIDRSDRPVRFEAVSE